ncbi:MAG TPA: four helix bundle protein [Verrucomicrobiae bacterium]|nr:four helix bundle protein [Verrucomicrobiae bacterium]
MKPNIIKDKSYSFALRIVNVARWLRSRKEFDLGSQVLRAGTGIGSNVEEAIAAVSRRDFVAKMGIASKEARESYYWLRLLRDSGIVPPARITPLVNDCLELVRILTAILKTTQLGGSRAQILSIKN